jgi:hypothetical protein
MSNFGKNGKVHEGKVKYAVRTALTGAMPLDVALAKVKSNTSTRQAAVDVYNLTLARVAAKAVAR